MYGKAFYWGETSAMYKPAMHAILKLKYEEQAYAGFQYFERYIEGSDNPHLVLYIPLSKLDK